MMRWDIINDIIRKRDYRNYLEIGYYKGWSFDQVHCVNKTAVDPNPCKDELQEKAAYGTLIDLGSREKLYKMTSDDWFKNVPTHRYDIVFIDGLHEVTQVCNDILNSSLYLSEEGTIVLHDCNPPTLEHTTTGVDGAWTGDVYRAVVALRRNEELMLYVLGTDWGVGLLRPYGEIIRTEPLNIEWEDFERERSSLLLPLDRYKDLIEIW